jgi:hypothetical protein
VTPASSIGGQDELALKSIDVTRIGVHSVFGPQRAIESTNRVDAVASCIRDDAPTEGELDARERLADGEELGRQVTLAE